MRHTIKTIITFLVLGILAVNGQENTIKKGNKNFDSHAFIDAREAYLKVAEEGYQSVELFSRLGDSYYFTADYKNAAKWYGALFSYSKQIDSEYLYRYAVSLKSTEKYVASDKIMAKFYETKGEDYRAKLFVNERNYLKEIELQSGRFKIDNAGFNSKLSDFAPAFNQNQLVFASNRQDRKPSKIIHDWNDQPFLDLYQVNIALTDPNKTIQKLPKSINTKYHESTAVYTKDGNTLYFTRNNYTNKSFKQDEAGTNRLKLYRATKKDAANWNVEELPFNNDEYSVAHPALSVDEKTLYFASDMPGGKGQSDLYKVAINGDTFGSPENLGEKINTESRETFPFVSDDNRLYFASDGHVGLGGLDVFVSDLDTTNNFGNVYNLGKPINSPQDDFTFIINEATGTGYFASNREGGKGDDDIYSLTRTEPILTKCTQTVEGVVLDENTSEPIPNAKVLLLDTGNNRLAEANAAADGTFNFDLECNKAYSIRASKEGYVTAEKSFATSNELGKENKQTLFMKKGNDLGKEMIIPVGGDLVKILGLNPIYFDLDKDYIRADAEIELRKVIAIMNLYPKMKIDVRSHTDSRADDDYNIDLSDRRAKSTIQYLVDNGIAVSRLTGKGYGETRIINRCSNGTPCQEYEHQLNRRSEFIIIEN
ncbi:PD40 domain-containing protein [Kordia sp. YSTF-M3]|uniref:PD40 domain-containing protein n=1 Tax=Kordia aestuariivivens TaxID=2759037 RepID=A0ABR7QGQ3_9FLAO|nr:OmpA family protein [Kordia aestuariivivens]MBC8757693.1 PD40 domain-containing protein [Kordia aestuariivivens]